MSDYKLITIDIDGTLLDSYGDLSIENKEAIENAINKGVKVVLASGRMPESVRSISEEIGATEYIIAGNGTLVYDMQKQENIYEQNIPEDKLFRIIDICEQNSIYYNLYTQNAIIANSLNYNVLYYHYENSKKSEDKKTNINIVDNIKKYIQDHNVKVLKITICDGDKVIFDRIIRKFREISNIEVLDVGHMSRKAIKNGTDDVNIEYYYTENSKKNTNKWFAIEYLMNLLNLKKEQVIAIGDNINDKMMIENAGLGISMGDSALSSMEIGDYITANNNESGVGQALNKFLN